MILVIRMNRKIGLGLIALLVVVLIVGTVGYVSFHRYKWKANYYRNAIETMGYRTWQDEGECWNLMGRGYYQKGAPLHEKSIMMMYYRPGYDKHRHEGGGLAGILVLLMIALGAYYLYSRHERKSKPIQILKERFARSEITREQYEEMKKVLQQDT